MALTHNQINKLWFNNPSYIDFKKHGFSKQIFTSKDADDFLKTGAYLIKEAEKLSNTHIPWDERRRFEILANPRLENAFISIGSEYLLKGVFLKNGFAINNPLPGHRLTHPIKISGNKLKLVNNEVQDLSYITNHIGKIIDFLEFNESQKNDEKKAKDEMKGKRLQGITRMTIPYLTAKQMLDYIHFKRNYSLHRPFIIPEFGGLTRQIFNFLDYVAQKGSGKGLSELAKLSEVYGEQFVFKANS